MAGHLIQSDPRIAPVGCGEHVVEESHRFREGRVKLQGFVMAVAPLGIFLAEGFVIRHRESVEFVLGKYPCREPV